MGKTKYIFVTGGVLSGVGKGITAAVSAGTTSDVIFSSPPVGASDGATVRHIVSVASKDRKSVV